MSNGVCRIDLPAWLVRYWGGLGRDIPNDRDTKPAGVILSHGYGNVRDVIVTGWGPVLTTT